MTRTVQDSRRLSRTSIPRHRLVGELMTRRVFAIEPDADFTAALAALRETGHEDLPVVDRQGRPMGMVCAPDLLAKLAATALPEPSVFETRRTRDIRHRAAAVSVAELMTTPVRSVAEHDTAADAALLALRHRIHQLPVVDDHHRLVGLVTLNDLLDALRRTDQEIEAEVRLVALGYEFGVKAATLHVTCQRGRVLLDARTSLRSQAERLLARIRTVEGVVDLAETLRWETDDSLPAALTTAAHKEAAR
ncbi:CBS domain-containing protein [Streptacidiphilus rugosus]|uniref:CBS domain-containing protein n=1 Tax=Streptacidiphilus rugosus TaxID=405783 RepID=UPI000690ADA6|nr:CBS domain-containing protein [Streptacidiphilus rugosus]